jgi:hypothetical protein
MPTIEIPESLFKRLQRLAIPLVDTTTTVIERLVAGAELGHDYEEAPAASHGNGIGARNGTVREFGADTPPDLRHTRILRARFGSRPASGWNNLVHAAHVEAFSQLRSLDVLRGVTRSNFITGRASSEDAKRGFRQVPEIDISIQNVDAEHAWSNALRLARHLGLEVRVDFEWMQKSDAAYPGKKGALAWRP